MSTFTITKIDKELGHVSVVYSVDGIEQTMCDAPLDDAAALQAFLNDYGKRYEVGLAQVQAVPPSVDALVGKPVEITAPVTPVDTQVDVQKDVQS